jgi:CheY-like chemotaxis protein
MTEMTDPTAAPPAVIDVLLVEDDPGDVLMTREAFEEHKLRNSLHVVTDGVEAVAFLRREGEYADVPRPGLILLDLNLPRKDGREVLAEIKADEALRTIPVVVLTTSEAEEDVLRSYDLHANAYVTKPVDLDQFMSAVRQIDEFFVQVVKLPNQ